jgi:hypothetical protein
MARSKNKEFLLEHLQNSDGAIIYLNTPQEEL